MQLFNELLLKFEQADWSRNPEFGLIDRIFETHPELYLIVKDDITKGLKDSNFGRKDVQQLDRLYAQPSSKR